MQVRLVKTTFDLPHYRELSRMAGEAVTTVPDIVHGIVSLYLMDITKLSGAKKNKVVEATTQLEYDHIWKALAENNCNVSATAKSLNMHRRTLQRKIKRLNIK